MKKLNQAAPVLVIAGLLLIWEAVVRIFEIPLYVLPAPSAMIATFFMEFPILISHAGVTVMEALVGMGISFLVALVIGVMIDGLPLFKRCIYPILVVTQTVPVIVLTPIFIIYMGFGYAPKIVTVVMMCFFPIVISFADGLGQMDAGYMNLVKTYGGNKFQLYWIVKIPSAMIALISGLKVAATYSISGAVVGEWIASKSGLGYYLIRAKNGYMLDKVFACVLMIILLSLLMNGMVKLFEYVVMPSARKKENNKKREVRFMKKTWKKMAALTLAAVMSTGIYSAVYAEDQAQELKKITVILDYVPNTNHTGMYVALDKGYYEEAGLDVEIIEPTDGATATLVAQQKGTFGIAYQEDVTIALTSADPLPIKAIATVIQHNTSGFVSLKDSGIESPEDFEGKTYAGWGGPGEAAVLEACMTQAGKDFSTLDMVISDGSGFEALGKNCDLMWFFEAWDNVMAQMNGCELNYMECRDLDERLDYYTPVIITSDAVIESDPEMVSAFLSATKKGYLDTIEDPDAAAEILLSYAPDYDIEMLKISQEILAGKFMEDTDVWGIMKDEVWDNYTEFMLEYGIIDKEIPAAECYTNAFLEQ